MLIRNGINQTLRNRKKSILFFSLILVLTLAVVFSVGINVFCKDTIESANERYSTIATIEYMGIDYPDDTIADSYARDAYSEINFDELSNLDGTKNVNISSLKGASLDGYTRKGNDLPYKDYAVLVLCHVRPTYSVETVDANPLDEGAYFNKRENKYVKDIKSINGYSAIITNSIYSYSGEEEIAINFVPNDEYDFNYDSLYLAHGYFTNSKNTKQNGLSTFVISNFDEDDEPFVELNDDNTYLLEDSIFTRYAEKYRDCNNFVFIKSSLIISDLLEFHEETLYLKEGTFPTQNDKDSCIITSDISESLGLNVGDSISLNMLSSSDDNVYDLEKTSENKEYVISGITNYNPEYVGYIYTTDVDSNPTLYGYLLATISIDNSMKDSVLLKIKEMMPENIKVSVYDQGYSTFVSAFETILFTSKVIIYISSLGVITAIILFSFIFILREKENIKTMIYFGVKKREIRLSILSGTLLVSISGCILGSLLGITLMPVILNMVKNVAEKLNESSLIYSETLLGMSKNMDIEINLPVIDILMVTLIIITIILIFTNLFLEITYKKAMPVKGFRKEKLPRLGKNINRKGSLKYALLSIRRQGSKSIAVPMLAFILTIVIIFLSGIYQGYDNTLKEAKENMVMEGQVVSLNGSTFYNLAISMDNVRSIIDIDLIDNVYVSGRYHYYIEGTMPKFGTGSFALEHRSEWIDSQPELVMVNNLLGGKEFYYVTPSVTYLEGYSEDIFTNDYPTILETYYGFTESVTYPVIVNAAYLEDTSSSLGDELNIYVTSEEIPLKVKIVGSYKGTGDTNYIYAPLSMYIPLYFLSSEEAIEAPHVHEFQSQQNKDNLYSYMYNNTCLSTLRFTIKDVNNIDSVRLNLKSNGFSYVGHASSNRTTIVIRDGTLTELNNTLGRYTTLGKVILILIMVIVSLISFIISWLMINGRKNEFVIMRGFGVKKQDVFLSFFLEQLILLLIGFSLGLLALIFLKSYGLILYLSLLGFIVSYMIGTSIEINIMNKINLMELISMGE